MVIGVWRYLRIATGKACTFLFVVWLQKGHQMSKKTIIFQEHEKVETREVDELFSFSILYHDKWNLRNITHQSEFVVVAMCRGLSILFAV